MVATAAFHSRVCALDQKIGLTVIKTLGIELDQRHLGAAMFDMTGLASERSCLIVSTMESAAACNVFTNSDMAGAARATLTRLAEGHVARQAIGLQLVMRRA